jgi:hypothetical protein
MHHSYHAEDVREIIRHCELWGAVELILIESDPHVSTKCADDFLASKNSGVPDPTCRQVLCGSVPIEASFPYRRSLGIGSGCLSMAPTHPSHLQGIYRRRMCRHASTMSCTCRMSLDRIRHRPLYGFNYVPLANRAPSPYLSQNSWNHRHEPHPDNYRAYAFLNISPLTAMTIHRGLIPDPVALPIGTHLPMACY